jgi:hypothetical protein
MQIKTVVEAPSAALTLDEIRDTLPSVTVGDRPEVHREHEWPGWLFFVLAYVMAVGLAAGAVGSVGWAAVSGSMEPVGWAVGAGLGAVLQWRLAKAVQHFSRWGWIGAMAELGIAAAAKLSTLISGDFGGAVFGLVIDVMWMNYFWENREQFDIDTDF